MYLDYFVDQTIRAITLNLSQNVGPCNNDLAYHKCSSEITVWAVYCTLAALNMAGAVLSLATTAPLVQSMRSMKWQFLTI